MRRVILLALLALALPTAALAGSIDYQNFGTVAAGTASITGSATVGGSLTFASQLTGINTTTGPLGWVTVSTGTLASCGAGCFSFTGGTLNIVNSSSATLFNGTFTSGTVLVSGGLTTITGFVGGVAGTVQIALTSAGILSGDTIVTPEPGTLGLLGTGLVGLAGMVRRKLRS
jgi:hypothetical protein